MSARRPRTALLAALFFALTLVLSACGARVDSGGFDSGAVPE